jgi:dTDP-6-deoxy-L-talose 4-dehydrogenase (NAD+)
VELDLHSKTDAASALDAARPEVVVHCAAYGVRASDSDPAEAVNVNVRGTVLLHAAACTFGARFVHVGSCWEYGSPPGAAEADAPLRPIGLYAATKAAASVILRERGTTLGNPPAIVRPFAMFGPGEPPYRLVPQIIDAARRRATLDLTAGTELRDFIAVQDVAAAIAALAVLPAARFPTGREFNLCSGVGRTVRSFAESIARILRAEPLLRFGALPSRTSQPANCVGDPAQWRAFCAQQGLGPQATALTPIAEVIELMAGAAS